MTQLDLIREFDDTCKERFNDALFMRSNEEVMQQLQNVIKSCERHNNYYYIQVLGFRIVDDYAEINRILYNYYEYLTRNKAKSKKKDNPFEYININQSVIRLLIVTYKVGVNLENNLSIRPEDLAAGKVKAEDTFDVYIAIPRIINRYYVKINGIVRSTLYQIVDGSTYNNNYTNSIIPNISFKIIFMAARVFRYAIGLPEFNTGKEIKLYNYRANIFNKTVCCCKYFLAKFGLIGAMNFLGIQGVYVSDTPRCDDYHWCFERAGIYVICDKYLTSRDYVTQSMVTCLYTNIIPGTNAQLMYDTAFWVRLLSGEFNKTSVEKYLAMFAGDPTVTDTYNKGLGILDSFENIYDISTKEDLRLKDSSKDDMYCVLRWILREFDALKAKDNYDVGIKRIRFGQYVAATYIFKVAKGINRVSDQNNRITVDSIKKAIRTDPMYLLNAISKSNLVSYNNMVSDMDGLVALKYSLKGISGIGEDDNKSIPDSIRFVHPSHVGRIDLDTSSDNNPGITGMISPFIRMENGYFSDQVEPDTWEERYQELYNEYLKAEGLREVFHAKDTLLDIPPDRWKVESADEQAIAMRKALLYASTAVSPKVEYYPFTILNGGDMNGV